MTINKNPAKRKAAKLKKKDDAKVCENAGYGFDKMLLWKKEVNKDVFFDANLDTAKVTFMLKNTIGGQTGGQTSGQTKSDFIVSKSQEKLLKIIKKNPTISRKEISEILGMNASAVQKNIEKLKKIGIVSRVGGDFGGKWIIKE